MSTLLRSWAVAPVLLAPLLVAAGGCADDKKTETPATTASAEQGPPKAVLDGKLAAAVKAAESAHASAPPGGDGPPDNGVFAPGFADKALAPGAPPKVELLKNGAEPRVVLTPAPADEQKETVSVTMRIQGGAIPVDYTLALKVDKPKDEKKDDKKDDKKPAGPKVVRVVAKATAIGLPPQIPREVGDKLGKLKGTEIRYTLGTDGSMSELAYTLPKDMDQGLGDTALRALVDALSSASVPLPKDPVGVGGYWMATDRAPSVLGIDVVRYRVFTVEKIDKDSATLSVTVRQYAAKDEAVLGALANIPRLHILGYESTGKGKLDWAAAALLTPRGDTSVRTGFQGAVGAADAQGQQQVATLQAEIGAKFSAEAPDKKK